MSAGNGGSGTHTTFVCVRRGGLEPPRPKSPDPKSGAATNYATCAHVCEMQSTPKRKPLTYVCKDTKLFCDFQNDRQPSAPRRNLTPYMAALPIIPRKRSISDIPISFMWTCTEPSSLEMNTIEECNTIATASSNSKIACMWLTGIL